jgi:ribonuclease-3
VFFEMNPLEQFLVHIPEIETLLSYSFREKALLILAFTHRSFINEYRELAQEHNERLEFLGDSLLGFLIANYLYHKKHDLPEGELSHLRSRLVQASACYKYVETLGVAKYVLLGKGERLGDQRGRDSIQANLFEAIIGAIFLDGGIDEVQAFLMNRFSSEFNTLLEKPEHNWKAELQDWAQRTHQQTPVYQLLSETGPDHQKHFVVAVHVAGQQMGTGEGSSKKEAQQKAAAQALSQLSL